MDGVLIDSEPLHWQATNAVLGSFGHQLSQKENEQFIGRNEEYCATKIIKMFGIPLLPKEYIGRRKENLSKIISSKGSPIEGAHTLLTSLQKHNYRLALASSSDRSIIGVTLEKLDMVDCFPIIVSGDQVTHAKPDPEIFLEAAKKLSIPPNSCVVIEDSMNGVLAAKAAGMQCIAIITEFTKHLDLSKADVVVESLQKIDVVLIETLLYKQS